MTMRTRIFFFGIVTILFFIISVPVMSLEDERVEPSRKSARLVVMPFFKGKFNAEVDMPLDNILTCKLKELCFVDTEIKAGAEVKLTRYFHGKLKERYAAQLVPFPLVSEKYANLLPYGSNETLKSLAIKLGQTINADLILAGTVWRYMDRSSPKGEPEIPASVAFVVYLIDVSEKRVKWKNSFIKRQTALSDDLSNISLFAKGGMKWLTADELAKYGVEKTLKTFNLPKVM